MDTQIRLPQDFKEFLKLLEANEVKYLLVGGYAVGVYGYPRPTGDIDIWVSNAPKNAERAIEALRQFGFDSPDLSPSLLMLEKSIIRMGVPPFKIEVITHIDGVKFDECYPRKNRIEIDGCPASVICLEDLLINKKASGRPKDLNDVIELENSN
ncbi:MAG TPA: nucleotidyltransferase [Pyrinomonadaceae bacterium]|nr:nucleotidyltransferase [Chloracidobacterium sp.]HRJ88848.1 nucleotidyltransferase [Pyrinomonadaceae bacterium]HRK48879.1 nucleotidyltransferase [Pyrinomonadaceae bacterium]